MSWTDARSPVPRLWIHSAEVCGGGGASLGEWEHKYILCFHFPNYFDI